MTDQQTLIGACIFVAFLTMLAFFIVREKKKAKEREKADAEALASQPKGYHYDENGNIQPGPDKDGNTINLPL